MYRRIDEAGAVWRDGEQYGRTGSSPLETRPVECYSLRSTGPSSRNKEYNMRQTQRTKRTLVPNSQLTDRMRDQRDADMGDQRNETSSIEVDKSVRGPRTRRPGYDAYTPPAAGTVGQ